jgi:hypothetical protein
MPMSRAAEGLASGVARSAARPSEVRNGIIITTSTQDFKRWEAVSPRKMPARQSGKYWRFRLTPVSSRLPPG